jgi:hypothetical protein
VRFRSSLLGAAIASLPLCACTYGEPAKGDGAAPQKVDVRPPSRAAIAEVEKANRCLGLVHALEPARRWVDAEILLRAGLDALEPGTAVKLLRQAERVEAGSGLSRDMIASIQQRSNVTIGSEDELERHAPEIRECVDPHLPSQSGVPSD